MEVEAVYHRDKDRFVLLQSVQIKGERSRVRIDFPDEDVLYPDVRKNQSEGELETDKILREIRAVKGFEAQYINDNKTDQERFADELERSEKYSA